MPRELEVLRGDRIDQPRDHADEQIVYQMDDDEHRLRRGQKYIKKRVQRWCRTPYVNSSAAVSEPRLLMNQLPQLAVQRAVLDRF
jgi:hypothetical protein